MHYACLLIVCALSSFFPLQLLHRHLQSALIADAFVHQTIPLVQYTHLSPSPFSHFVLSFLSLFLFVLVLEQTEQNATITISLKFSTHIAFHSTQHFLRRPWPMCSLCSVNNWSKSNDERKIQENVNDVDIKINLIIVISFDFIALKFTFGAFLPLFCYRRPNDIDG